MDWMLIIIVLIFGLAGVVLPCDSLAFCLVMNRLVSFCCVIDWLVPFCRVIHWLLSFCRVIDWLLSFLPCD